MEDHVIMLTDWHGRAVPRLYLHSVIAGSNRGNTTLDKKFG